MASNQAASIFHRVDQGVPFLEPGGTVCVFSQVAAGDHPEVIGSLRNRSQPITLTRLRLTKMGQTMASWTAKTVLLYKQVVSTTIC